MLERFKERHEERERRVKNLAADREEHDRVLRNAASLHALTVTCHPDTMEELTRHYDPLGRSTRTTNDDGTQTVEVSGLSLCKAMDGLRSWNSPGVYTAATVATAARLYAVLKECIEAAGPGDNRVRAVRIDGNAWEPVPGNDV